jgi:hypothetical protein
LELLHDKIDEAELQKLGQSSPEHLKKLNHFTGWT